MRLYWGTAETLKPFLARFARPAVPALDCWGFIGRMVGASLKEEVVARPAG